MEDAHITHPEVSQAGSHLGRVAALPTVGQVPSMEGWSFYSVLDGHAGEEVAHYSEEHLLASVLYEVEC